MWIPMSSEAAEKASDEELVQAYMEYGLDRASAEAYVAQLRNTDGWID